MVWPPGAIRYPLTWLAGSLASTTSASMSRSSFGRFDGTLNSYAATCPSPGERPLPPVSTPLNVPPLPSPAAIVPRSVTGTVTAPPADRPPSSTTAPLESPAPDGTTAETRIVADAPGARESVDGDTVPKDFPRETDAPNRTFPFVPPAFCASLKITAVQVPAAGCSTWALPYPPTPCGSECAASRPAGSTRMSLTRLFRLAASDAFAGQAIEVSSTACPEGTLKVTAP